MNRGWVAFSLGLVLIVVSNAVALMGVASNREEPPESVLELTERELPWLGGYRYGLDEESTGVRLRFDRRIDQRVRPIDAGRRSDGRSRYDPTVPWLEGDRLVELGFEVPSDPSSKSGKAAIRRQGEREVILVLEIDGDAHRAALAEATRERDEALALLESNPDKQEFRDRFGQNQKGLELEHRARSRLFVIDAGLDPRVLRHRYSNRKQYALVAGRVRISQYYDGESHYRVVGYVTTLNITGVHVPRPHSEKLRAVVARSARKEGKPRYAVTVAIGRHLEPWVLEVRALGGEEQR